MNIETVKPQVIDGVEFYVNNDGSCTGLSISGLARLCGVSRKAISLLVNALDGGTSTVPKQLECLRGNVFLAEVRGEATGGFDEAKIISHVAAAKIIKYYACDSKAANDMAKVALDRFIEKGLDSWIKEVTGYQEPVKATDSQELVSTIQQVLGEVKDIKRHIGRFQYAATVYPTIDALAVEQDTLALPSAETYTVKEWLGLEQGSMELNPSQYMRLCTTIAIAYKALTGNRPESRSNNKATPIRVYRQEHFKLMSECLAKLD